MPPILGGLSCCAVGVIATRPIRKAHPLRLALEIVTAAGLGGFPAATLFVHSVDGGRFIAIDLILGFTIGILMSSAVTRWAARFLRPSGPNADALGPFAGACIGTLLALALAHAMYWTVDNAYVVALGAALVGTVTTAGLQLRGG